MNQWPMRIFYGMIESAVVNVYVIFIKNVPNYASKTLDKRNKFLKEVAVILVTSYASQRLDVHQIPKDVKQTIRNFAGTIRHSK